MTDSNKKQVLTVEEAIEQVARGMALEIFKLFDQQSEYKGTHYGRDLASRFLSHFVFVALVKALDPSQLSSNLTKEEMCALTADSFADMKLRFQESVSGGFTNAMSKFAGKYVDYYCDIRVVPTPVNKQPC